MAVLDYPGGLQNNLSALGQIGGLSQSGYVAPATTVIVPISPDTWAKFSNATKLAILEELGIIAKEVK